MAVPRAGAGGGRVGVVGSRALTGGRCAGLAYTDRTCLPLRASMICVTVLSETALAPPTTMT